MERSILNYKPFGKQEKKNCTANSTVMPDISDILKCRCWRVGTLQNKTKKKNRHYIVYSTGTMQNHNQSHEKKRLVSFFFSLHLLFFEPHATVTAPSTPMMPCGERNCCCDLKCRQPNNERTKLACWVTRQIEGRVGQRRPFEEVLYGVPSPTCSVSCLNLNILILLLFFFCQLLSSASPPFSSFCFWRGFGLLDVSENFSSVSPDCFEPSSRFMFLRVCCCIMCSLYFGGRKGRYFLASVQL